MAKVEEVTPESIGGAGICLIDLTPVRRGVFGTIESIREKLPALQLLFLTSAAGDYVLQQANRFGASVLHEFDQPDALNAAIAAVLSGAVYYSPEALSRRTQLPTVRQLTAKELAVLELASTSIGDVETARHLGCGSSTVETHRRNVMAKLKLSDWTELAAYGLRAGIVGSEEIQLSNKTRRTSLRRLV